MYISLNRIRKIIYDIPVYCFALIVILDFRTIWQYIPGNERLSTINSILLLIIFAACLVRKKKFDAHGLRIGFLVMALFAFAFVMVLTFNSYADTGWVRYLLVSLIMIGYHYWCDQKDEVSEFFYKFADIVLLIAVVSLFFWIFGSMLRVIHPSGYELSTWNSLGENKTKLVPSYYSVYFETQTISFFGIKGLVRNSAIFTEGPMCSFIFCIALLIEYFVFQERSKIRNYILILAILTTFSTTGYIALLGIIFFRFQSKAYKSQLINILKTTIFPVALIILVILIDYFVQDKLQSRSGSVRLDDVRAGVKAWLDSPILGNGFGNRNSYQQYFSLFRKSNTGYSNSILQVLAYGGVVLFLPYLVNIILMLKNALASSNKGIKYAYIIFLAMFATTISAFQALPIYLLITFAANKFELAKSEIKFD